MNNRPLAVKVLLVVSVVCLAVALVVTLGWVDAAGNARDGWLVGGLLAYVGSVLVEKL